MGPTMAAHVLFVLMWVFILTFIVAGVVSVVVLIRHAMGKGKRFEPHLCPRCGCDIDPRTGACPDCEMTR